MKNIFRIIAVVALMMLLSTESAWAGNDRRRGTSGAMELLINGFLRCHKQHIFIALTVNILLYQ